jgi:3-deoxy-D-manno-octulosonate 8-phosphate phosphatase (KDO 8-P phosphatase)
MQQLAPARWAAIRLFAMDVDGILTDGTVFVSSDGTEAKQFSILDGMGLVRLGRAGATTVRANELKIPHIIQGRTDKRVALEELAAQLGLGPAQIAYMGDDDIDASAIRWAGIGVSVPDAMPAAIEAATYLTRRPAGRGAVREVCEHILAARGHSPSH